MPTLVVGMRICNMPTTSVGMAPVKYNLCRTTTLLEGAKMPPPPAPLPTNLRSVPGEGSVFARPFKIFFSVGEPSGDLHGANLIRQLRARCPQIEIVGYGGPQMAAAGCTLHEDLTALAVMWFARVFANLKTFLGLLSRAKRYFREQRPDAVVLIDYPGFNWWIARYAKAEGIPVFYYTPPQIWAWATWRVKKMRKFVDHVLCSLPFEKQWYNERGCDATFVGHPFFDEVRRLDLDEEFLEEYRKGDSPIFHGDRVQPTINVPPAAKNATVPCERRPLVVILPGSRTQEVTQNLRWFLRAADIVREKVPQARFALACFKPHQAEIARKQVKAAGLPIEIHVGKTPELMHLADCAMAVSGSVSLELLYHATPTVILYHVGRFAYQVQKFFRKVKYITLVNLLSTGKLYTGDIEPFDPAQPDAEQVLFPEYLTCEDKSAQLAGHIVEWLAQPEKRAARIEQLEKLRAEVAHGGASSRAAEYILTVLSRGKSPVPPPYGAMKETRAAQSD
ncbi:MAG: lipid-A-disaccharide synthase [Pirellulales bacterium]|nr:lipid-A-disaccharide synthase [Pirellulales bacterium]